MKDLVEVNQAQMMRYGSLIVSVFHFNVSMADYLNIMPIVFENFGMITEMKQSTWYRPQSTHLHFRFILQC